MEVDYGYDRDLVSLETKERTLRFHLFGRGAFAVSRQDFIKVLKDNGADDIIGTWKAENPFEIFAAFDSTATAHRLLDVGNFKVGETSVFVSSQDDVLNDCRVYWTPLSVKQAFLEDYFHRKGFKVLSSRMETDNGIYTGNRFFRLIAEKSKWDALPHVVDFHHLQFQALLAVTGRPPLCLKCRKLGHRRAQCDQNPGARFAARQLDQQQQQQQKPVPQQRRTPQQHQKDAKQHEPETQQHEHQAGKEEEKEVTPARRWEKVPVRRRAVPVPPSEDGEGEAPRRGEAAKRKGGADAPPSDGSGTDGETVDEVSMEHDLDLSTPPAAVAEPRTSQPDLGQKSPKVKKQKKQKQ